MTSEIYKIRNRGQVVTEACQWITKHYRLALQLAVRPLLILALIEAVNIIFMQNLWITIILSFIALLLVPTVPSMAVYVVEHSEEYDYPQRLPKLLELWELFMKYFRSALVIGFIGTIISLFCGMTMVGPAIINFIRDMAIVIHQRDKGGYISVLLKAFSLSLGNFASLMMTILGTSIITLAMITGPLVLILAYVQLLPTLTSPQINEVLENVLDSETQAYLALEWAVIGYMLASMISLVISHFFYGHAVLCEQRSKEERMARMKEREEERERRKKERMEEQERQKKEQAQAEVAEQATEQEEAEEEATE